MRYQNPILIEMQLSDYWITLKLKHHQSQTHFEMLLRLNSIDLKLMRCRLMIRPMVRLLGFSTVQKQRQHQ